MKGDWWQPYGDAYGHYRLMLQSWLMKLASTGEYPFAVSGPAGSEFPRPGDMDALGWTPSFRHDAPQGTVSALFERDGAVLLVTREPEGCYHLLAQTGELRDELRAALDDGEAAPDDGRIDAGFWSSGRSGGDRRARKIAAQPWEKIANNYTAGVRGVLDGLTRVTPDALAGRMVLLYGPPGTGKTTFLRALARAWGGWATLEYVIDPEQMLDYPSYLTDIVMGGEDGKHRLLILEDAGELIGAGAKDKAGQCMARLLNATDGILGDGAKVVVAITCNEDVSALHPAVTRAGRCLARAEFAPLTAAEASAWLGRRVSEPMTVAELYAARNGTGPAGTAEREDQIGAYL